LAESISFGVKNILILKETLMLRPTHTPPSTWIVYMSTFPPRECGIATFTQDLVTTFDELFSPKEESKVIVLERLGAKNTHYDADKVLTRICETEKSQYRAAALQMNNTPEVKMICIQHEFGIFGGKNGSYLLEFLRAIQKPVTITLHTVVPPGSPHFSGHRAVLKKIDEYVRLVIVMTETSRQLLVDEYQFPPEKVQVIQHGIHARPYQGPHSAQAALGWSGQKNMTTFGFLGRGKGIEYAIEAFAEIVQDFPEAAYHICGVTHPVIVEQEGEAYRNELIQKTKDLGIEKNIFFYNEYFSTEKILQILYATDIYLSVSLDPNQAISGTLSYALGAGRPVVSTAFAQAKEDVTSDIGRLVSFRNPGEIAAAVKELLRDDQLRKELGERAYFRTRGMTWQNVTISYMKEFARILPEIGVQEKNLPRINLEQFTRLTDSFGMFQFARRIEPDIESGYTLDDNARAMIAVIGVAKKYRQEEAFRLAEIYLRCLEYIFSFEGYNNYVNHDQSFHIERNTTENLNDANARGMYALAIAATAEHMPVSFQRKARELFREHFDEKSATYTPRGAGFYIKALKHWLDYEPSEKYQQVLESLCQYLLELYEVSHDGEWRWFEDLLAYSNGIIPEALFVAYQHTKDQRYFNVAKSSLDFLVQHSFQGDICVPVGQQGWFRKGQSKTNFDQQPEEVTALVLALRAAYEASGDEQYVRSLFNAFDWFLGNNLLGQVVYDQSSGGCYDGLGEKSINLNQGAESTVSYLVGRLAMDDE
jgi:glycosyltransferase involved in cell wall biosynthesis